MPDYSITGSLTLPFGIGDIGVDLTVTDLGGGTPPPPPPPPASPVPYLASSGFNLPIPPGVATHPDSAAWLALVDGNNDGGKLTSDITQNNYPLYFADASTPRVTVTLGGFHSSYEDADYLPNGDCPRTGGHGQSIPNVPIPVGAQHGGGSDQQYLVVDGDDEWAFWQFDNSDPANPTAENGYRLNHTLSNGRTVQGGRGAGVAKWAGLVTAAEVAAGQIDHAIAVAFSGSQVLSDPSHVWPATKSDGTNSDPTLMPEGARLQLDPTLTDADFDAMGLTETGKTIARAMQTYGLIVVDRSGRNKMFLEAATTGTWAHDAATMEYICNALVDDGTGANWGQWFRVLDFNDWTGGDLGLNPPNV
jgi:hypothetical protein